MKKLRSLHLKRNINYFVISFTCPQASAYMGRGRRMPVGQCWPSVPRQLNPAIDPMFSLYFHPAFTDSHYQNNNKGFFFFH